MKVLSNNYNARFIMEEKIQPIMYVRHDFMIVKESASCLLYLLFGTLNDESSLKFVSC